MHSTVTKTVSAPIDRVWALLADHEGMSGWAPGLSVRLTSTGSPDRNGLGAVRRISPPGPVPAIVEEITGFEPGRRLSYRAISGVPLKNYTGDVRLSETLAGTAISYTVGADQRIPFVEKALTRLIATGLLIALVRQTKRH